MAKYGEEYGRQVDEYGNPVRATDEYGNPIYRLGTDDVGQYETTGGNGAYMNQYGATGPATTGAYDLGTTGDYGTQGQRATDEYGNSIHRLGTDDVGQYETTGGNGAYMNQYGATGPATTGAYDLGTTGDYGTQGQRATDEYGNSIHRLGTDDVGQYGTTGEYMNRYGATRPATTGEYGTQGERATGTTGAYGTHGGATTGTTPAYDLGTGAYGTHGGAATGTTGAYESGTGAYGTHGGAATGNTGAYESATGAYRTHGGGPTGTTGAYRTHEGMPTGTTGAYQTHSGTATGTTGAYATQGGWTDAELDAGRGQLHRTGSSSSEDDGYGGRRKKGLKEKIKEKLHSHDATTTTTTGGYGYEHDHPHHKKGMMEKIMDKLPGCH